MPDHPDELVLDGFLDEEIEPGEPYGSNVRFRLILSPTDERAEETVLPCRVDDPIKADSLLHDAEPGDLMRVFGYLRLPRSPSDLMWLVATRIDLLGTTPPPAPEPPKAALGVDRWGPYVGCARPLGGRVQVWAEDGAWVGCANTAADVGGLITAYEQRQDADGE